MATVMRARMRLSQAKAFTVGVQGIRQYRSTAACLSNGKYLQESAVPSMYFQNALPRLPVPKLDESLDRYLDSIKPITTPEEYTAHATVVEKFRSDEGPKLQAMLEAMNKANKKTSYIGQAWFDKYLSDPSPIAVHSNPYIAFNPDPVAAKNNQLDRATLMVNSALRFMFTLDDSKLKPDAFHMNPAKTDTPAFLNTARWIPDIGPLRWVYAFSKNVYPLDMSQYGRLFNSTRLPRETKDELYTDRSAKHLAVMRNGRFYFFDVLDNNGNALPMETIRNNIAGILNVKTGEAEYSIGAMTTTDRPSWAKVRAEMEKDESNRANLKMLDSALFLYNLDDEAPQEEIPMSRQMLFGKGRDRYFDKSFSLITRKDGLTAVNFEHAWGDGVAVLRFINEVYADVNATPAPTGSVAPITPTEVKFNLSNSVQDAIKKADSEFTKLVNGLQFSIARVGPMGRDEIKQYGVSADAVCQFVIQYGFYKMTNKFAATYESCSTAAFKHGRTETVRSNTPETKDCVLTFADPKSTYQQKLEALQTAAKKHGELTKNAATGKGFDRHMYMLRKFAEESTGKTPELYKAGGVWDRMNHIILSTSTLQSESIFAGGFAPVSADGFGIGYGLIEGFLGLHITNYEKKADVLAGCIEEGWAEIAAVFKNSKASSSGNGDGAKGAQGA
eukprot:CFRG7164T1